MRRALGLVRRHPLAAALLTVAALGALAGGGVAARRQRDADLLRRAEERLAAHEYAASRELLGRYLESRPSDARARLLAARAARRLRQYAEAREHLRRCRQDGGDAEAAAVESALIDVQQGDESPLPDLRRRALRGDELGLAILEVLIQHDIDTYQLRQALQGLALYLEQRPDDLQARLGRGKVWERMLYFADAVEDYRKAVAAHPDSERARLRLADTLLIAGTPDEALEQYRWLAQRRPKQPEVRLGLARCRRRLGQIDEARGLLDALLADAPGHGEVLLERGQLALDEGRAADAEQWLRRALAALPYNRSVTYSLSRCLRQLRRPDEAAEFEKRTARLDADVRRLGQVCQAVMKHPEDVALRCEGARLFLNNGERREGVRWLHIALRLDPHCREARAALAEAGEGPAP